KGGVAGFGGAHKAYDASQNLITVFEPGGNDGNGIGGGLRITLTDFQQAVQDALNDTDMIGSTSEQGPGTGPTGTDPIPPRQVNNTIVWSNQGFRKETGTSPSQVVADEYSGLPTLDHDLIGVDPKLGPLADNGGPTMTMAPLPGSPAID